MPSWSLTWDSSRLIYEDAFIALVQFLCTWGRKKYPNGMGANWMLKVNKLLKPSTNANFLRWWFITHCLNMPPQMATLENNLRTRSMISCISWTTTPNQKVAKPKLNQMLVQVSNCVWWIWRILPQVGQCIGIDFTNTCTTNLRLNFLSRAFDVVVCGKTSLDCWAWNGWKGLSRGKCHDNEGRNQRHPHILACVSI